MENSDTLGQADQMIVDLEGETLPESEFPQSDATAVASSSTRWMERSKLRKHFQIKETKGSRTASCIYCSRVFYESKSTGNLSKHVKNKHPQEFKHQIALQANSNGLDSLLAMTRSLPLPSSIVAAWKHSPGDFAVIALLTEKLLPFSIVEAAAWQWMGKAFSDLSLVQSRNSISQRLEMYTKSFDNVIRTAMQKSDFINLELDIWSGGNGKSYLAIAASFAPNLLNEKRLHLVGNVSSLLNNNQKLQNSHLLDFVDISDIRHTGENLFNTLIPILNHFEIFDKVASITSDNATNNICMHSFLVNDSLKVQRPEAYEKLRNCHLIRCCNHILNILFQAIVKALKSDQELENALIDITKLGKKIRRSAYLRSSVKNAGLPLIPIAPETRWLYLWEQVSFYLKYRGRYLAWLESVKRSETYGHLAEKIESHMKLSPRVKHILEYFVSCCSIYKFFNDSMQDETLNRLRHAPSFYYTMELFYDLCQTSKDGTHVEEEQDGSFDFSFLNGDTELPPSAKTFVLDAVLSTKKKFDEYMSHFNKTDIYFVAAFLDPSSKFTCFDECMSDDEKGVQVSKVETYLRNYLGKCKASGYIPVVSSSVPQNTGRPKKIGKYPRVSRKNKGVFKTATFLQKPTVPEWSLYCEERLIEAETDIDVVKWWYDRRHIYPNLYRLAVPLLYTKISTCGIERTFSISGRLMRQDRRSLGSSNTKNLMLLRNRFTNFGLYDKEIELVPSSNSDDTLIVLSDDDDSSISTSTP
ncbi:putative transposase of the Rover3 hAT-like family [Lachancea dasiensis]|uniref:Putative transposase of the Rover3 hAT-like family n=1 Tax=Lachancea dasiensis TaxID=1072105 RepID=A0A1G4J8B8_9SACH|nr:putative transposase of the Rover3 hAT-like family [Lachancea dasiensis]